MGRCLMGGWVGRPMRPQLVGPAPCCLLPPSPPISVQHQAHITEIGGSV